jgi:hypothetical protein
MAAPVYTTDLTTYSDATTTTGWVELTAYNAAGGPTADTDLAIHGSTCITMDRAKTTRDNSLAYDGTAPTLPTNGGFFIWHKFFAPNSLATLANGGVRIYVGSTVANYDGWNIKGNDNYQYGGWENYVIDPTIGTPDETLGGGVGDNSLIGFSWNLLAAPSKGNPFNVDIIRYGRGISEFTLGDLANGYATFLGFSLVNDHPTEALYGRSGLFQAVGSGYLWKGLMSLGVTATAVDMRDSNVVITIDDTPLVTSAFNRIEVHNASSNVEWTSVNFTALGTVSRGEFEMVDDCSVTLTGCVFTDMSTFIFKSSGSLDSDTFRRCDQITQGSASFASSIFTNSTSATSVLSNNPALISECTFVSDGSNHALELTTAGTYSFSKNVFTNYAVIDGVTGNESVYNNSGGLVTLNVTDALSPTIRNGAGATTVVNNNVAITFTGLKDNTEVRVYASGSITELAGIENVTAGTVDDRSFTFSLAAGTSIDYRIHNLDYEIIQIYAYSLPATATTLPFQQRLDRWYNA